MIPLRDANPSRTTPVVTIALIAANCLVFLYELSLGQSGLARLIYAMGMVPAKVAVFPVHPEITATDALSPFFTSMFLHGGFLHLIGNMWFLWIFGDNVEDHLGHLRYLLFYLVCGLGAGLTHLIFNWGSNLPTIGASGAVAGVLGGYMLLYPRHRVLTLIPIFIIFYTVELPAVFILVYWFIIQFLSGAASTFGGAAGGVAWWAHVGGFLLGLVLVRTLAPPRRPTGGFRYRVVD